MSRMPGRTVQLPVVFYLLLVLTQTTAKYSLRDEYTSSPAQFFDSFNFFTGEDPTNGFTDYIDYNTAIGSQLLGYIDPLPATTSPANASADLYNTRATSIYIAVDHTNYFNDSNVSVRGRPSVRLTSIKTYNPGMLLVADIQHMPTGCSLWPSLWLLGSSAGWPQAGEVDIIEGVNNAVSNSMTLHTSQGCIVTNNTGSESVFIGTMHTDDCWVDAPGQAVNEGCSILAPVYNSAGTAISVSTSANGTGLVVGDVGTAVGVSISSNSYGNTVTTTSTASPATFGVPFNAQGGGVYVLEWAKDGTGFSIWFFPRSANANLTDTGFVPASLAPLLALSSSTAELNRDAIQPNPSTFGIPIARFTNPSSDPASCDFAAHFSDMQIVLNTALCGSWAGQSDVWAGNGGVAGASCAALTGYATCGEYVRNVPGGFEEAWWGIGGLWVFGEE